MEHPRLREEVAGIARVPKAYLRPRSAAVAILALAAAAAVVGAVHGGFTDLSVYRYGGRAVLDDESVYASDDPGTGLPFTYPPFAAVLMTPLALLPPWLAAALWTGLSVGCLAAVVVMVRRALGRPTFGRMVVLLTVGALALEPVWQNLAFGQVNLILMLAVLVDLLRPERRFAGVLVGVAAGIKLTPLVFIVLLVLVARTAAGRAVLAFAGTVLVGFVAMPDSATTYWTHGLVDPGRVGPPALAHNQSVYGALTRLLDGPPSTLGWLALAGPVTLAVLFVAAAYWRRGDRVLGACLGALAMLLASPVSWSHHWVWVVPVALAVWECSRAVAVVWLAVFVARPVLWPPWGERREYGWGPTDHLLGNAYLLAALALVGGAAFAARHGLPWRHDRRRHTVGAATRRHRGRADPRRARAAAGDLPLEG